MLINADDVLARANELYAQAKGPTPATADDCNVPAAGWWCSRDAGHEGPCAARSLPRIQSDQVKATIKAIVEAINKELFNPIVVHCEAPTDDEAE